MLPYLEKNYIDTYNYILKIVPEFKERIEKGNVPHNIIVAIARSVMVEKNEDGSFSISEQRNRNFDITKQKEQIDNIREIFSKRTEIAGKEVKKRKSEDAQEVDVTAKKRREHENVVVKRGGIKRPL